MNINNILAAAALLLALLAAVAGTPVREEEDMAAIAALIESEQDHIAPLDLAEMIIAGKKLRLIDLRDSTSFVNGRIAGAERLTMVQLVSGSVTRNERIVLYSEGGIHASQGWMMLKMKRFVDVTTLLGGYNGWKETVLYPKLRKDDPDVDRRVSISRYFGGEPVMITTDLRKRSAGRKEPLAKQIEHIPPPRIDPPEEDRLREGC